MKQSEQVKEKQICFISPSLQLGGIERAMSILANFFSKKENTCIHFVNFFPFEPFFQLEKKIKVYYPPYKFSQEKRTHLETIYYYYKILSPVNGYILKTVKEIKPDVIICFGDWFPHAIMLQIRHLKIPFYYCNRSNPLIKYNLFFELIRKLAYRIAPPAGIIAQTTAAAERKKRIVKGNIPIKIIPNPVLKMPEIHVVKKNWIVSVGRLHLEKGFIRLFEAFSKVNAPDWKLVIAGSGIHSKIIKERAKDLGIEDRVDFLGKVSNIPLLLAQSRIFVLASHHEGFPNALCEAMAAGLPCLSFDIIAGPRDIIQDGKNGYLIPDGDNELLALKIQYLVENENVRESIGAEAGDIVNRFSLEKVGQAYYDFIICNN